jgi:thiol-disulfide isomerase/thioredoxin
MNQTTQDIHPASQPGLNNDYSSMFYGLIMLLGLFQTVCTNPASVYAADKFVAVNNQPIVRPSPADNPFPGQSPAPSLVGGTEWLNTNQEIKLSDLKGKIVLLDFWTYCCINCMHILPDLKYLEEKYPNELVVIGVHSAKFENEKQTDNIRNAILRYEIKHPVINDSEMVVWQKYNIHSWPSLVIIDPEGQYVGFLSGEGKREALDEVISSMIAYHRAAGTLNEKPIKFEMESEKVKATPLNYPGKILADVPGNRLFVSDSNHNRIVISDLNGQLLETIGTGQIGTLDGDYASASFFRPQGMALVGQQLYVADTENHMIRQIDLVTKKVSTLAGTGQQARGYGPGGDLRMTALNSPWDIVAHDNSLYIAMAGPHQIWKHDLGSHKILVFAGNGREDIIDGTRQGSALAQPSGIVNIDKNLFFVDSEGSAVRELNLTGSNLVTTIAGPHDLPRGRSLFEFADKDGVGDAARFQHPIGIATDGQQLFVCDSYNHKVKTVNPTTREVKTLIGEGKRGNSLSPLQLNEPSGATLNGMKLLIADTNNHRIISYDLAANTAQEFVIQGLTPPVPPRSAVKTIDEKLRQQVKAVVVRPHLGAVTARIEVELPEGFKLNPLVEPTVIYSVRQGNSIIPEYELYKRKIATVDKDVITCQIPFGQPGIMLLGIDLSYQYCRDGEGGVCKIGQIAWTIPVQVDAGGTGSVIKLNVQAP